MKVNSAIIAVFSFRFLGLCLSFLLTVYLSRTIEKNELGHYFWLVQIILLLTVFIKRGTDLAALKYGAIASNKDIKVISSHYFLYTLLPVSLFLLTLIAIAKIFLSSQTYLDIQFIALCIIPISLSFIAAELLKGRDKQISGAVFQACLPPALIFSIFIISKQSIISSYLFASISLMILSLAWVYYKIIKENQKNINDIFSQNQFWSDSKAFFAIALLNVIMNSMDILMLGGLLGSIEVANYGIANKLVALSSIILIAVNGLIGPKFSALWRKEKKEELNNLFIKVTVAMLFTSIAMLLFFILAGKSVLIALYGAQYSSSYELLVILAIGQALVLGTGPVAYLLMMTDSKDIYRKSLFLAAGTNFIFNIILIPEYGAVGAAIATVIGLTIKNIYSLLIANKIFIFFKLGYSK